MDGIKPFPFKCLGEVVGVGETRIEEGEYYFPEMPSGCQPEFQEEVIPIPSEKKTKSTAQSAATKTTDKQAALYG